LLAQRYNNLNGTRSYSNKGGVEPHSYLWLDSDAKTLSNSDSIINLPRDNYTLRIIDHNQCSKDTTFYLTQPELLTDTLIVQDKVCAVPGIITCKTEGGVLNENNSYSYKWSSSDTTDVIYPMEDGNYSVTITDLNGCTVYDTATIVTQDSMQISIEIISPITCNGFNDGHLQASIPNGDAPPYEYIWNGVPGGKDIYTAAPGTHILEVRDVNECYDSDTIDILEPEQLASLIEVNNVNCFDSANANILLYASGGTGNIRYYFEDSLVNGNEIVGLKAGSYTMKIVDGNNCTITEPIEIIQPEQIIIQAFDEDITRPVCAYSNDGSITVTVTGGFSPYRYRWLENESTVEFVSNVPAGTYTVEVTDNSNCIVEQAFVLENELPACLEITSAFTPNGDGFNETWEITNPLKEDEEIAVLYPDLSIEVFNRVGQRVWNSPVGYPRIDSWLGVDNFGKKLPVDSYFYIIHLNNGTGVIMQGIVTIVR
jgi:gliding motility-associated-like protein